MRTKTKHKVNAATPRLSDEELDPIEQDDNEGVSSDMMEAYLPWSLEDIMDVKRLIADKLPAKQQFIMDAFLDGLSYKDINVTEKYWRYHFAKAINYIKGQLGV